MKPVLRLATAIALCLSGSSAVAQTNMVPLRLRAGINTVANIAGDGRSGTITLNWRENGNAWGYDIYTVVVSGSVVTHEVDGVYLDSFHDTPHMGDDMVTSVRFARGSFAGRATLLALVASRNYENSVPEPARTTITIYALMRNDSGTGTPFEFTQISQRLTERRYCNADMALRTELGFPLSGSYSGPSTASGC